MDKLIKKLTKLLSKNGVEEEVIDKIVAELDGGKNPDEVADEGEVPGDEVPEDAPVEEGETTPEDVKGDVNESMAKAPQEEAPTNDAEGPAPEAPTEDVPAPTPDPDEVNPADLIPAEGEVPPVTEGVEQPMTEGPDPLLEYQAKIDDLNGIIEGLTARIDSLENALKTSGVMTEEGANEGTAAGLDNPRVPANNPADDPLNDILSKINRNRM